MDLNSWLDATGTSLKTLSSEIGCTRSNLDSIAKGLTEPAASIALGIIRYAARNPAPGGGRIALEDLVVPRKRDKLLARKRINSRERKPAAARK